MSNKNDDYSADVWSPREQYTDQRSANHTAGTTSEYQSDLCPLVREGTPRQWQIAAERHEDHDDEHFHLHLAKGGNFYRNVGKRTLFSHTQRSFYRKFDIYPWEAPIRRSRKLGISLLCQSTFLLDETMLNWFLSYLIVCNNFAKNEEVACEIIPKHLSVTSKICFELRNCKEWGQT